MQHLIIMKKIIITIGLVFFVATLSFGQSKGFTFGAYLQASNNSPFSNNYEFRTQSFTVAPGYSFNGRLSARVPVSMTTEFYQLGGA